LQLAQKVVSSLGFYPRDKMLQMQSVLLGPAKTVAFQVQGEGGLQAWEVPVQFTVGDARELLQWKARLSGAVSCRGFHLADELMLGFVQLYLWRSRDTLELEVSPKSEAELG
jgi:hypothetical protein